MLTLPLHLQNGHSYQNSGPFFARAFAIKQLFKEKNHGLLISPENKDIQTYHKILSYLQVNIARLEYQNDISNLFFNNRWLYVITPDDYETVLESEKQLKYNSLEIYINMEISQEAILEKLHSLWYNFSDFKSPGSYKKSWDIIHIVSPCWQYNYSISAWWDRIDSIEISEIFHDLIRNTQNINKIYIGWCRELVNHTDPQYTWNQDHSLWKLIENSQLPIIADHINFHSCYESLCHHSENIISFDVIKNNILTADNLEITSPKISNLDLLKQHLESHKQVHIYTKNYDTIDNFLEYNNITHVALNKIKISQLESFKIDNILIICDDILSNVFIKKRIRKNFSADMDLLMKIKPEDYVVHIDHWIGIFNWIIEKKLGAIHKEYIEVEYSWNEKLFVPIMEVSRVSKYVWVQNPKLTWLWWNAWEKSLKSASQDATKIAAELLEIYSKRKHDSGYKFQTNTTKQSEFIHSFGHIYTEDQSEAVEEILNEMGQAHSMDRLLIGDVGFGKTEVAFNAIYNSYLNGKQSLLITPLVVLAYEHYEKAIERFADFGLKIWVLTRFESAKKSADTLLKLSKWELDLVVWTHKLLSEKIIYKNLWLLVIDEEHKFGVSDKEKIKKFKSHIDVLTMSATPIPRSLNMALSRIRSMSQLKLPPTGRKDIETSVLKFNETIISEACQKEFDRGWQVFFIHNRVSNIDHMKKLLLNLFPDKKIAIAHGQLSGDALERRIIDFKHKKYNILLATTVIENGIDFPNVNTIFINEAQRFGISQIHQLRGRVWRADKKWYCYLMFKYENLKEDSAKRLQTIVQYSYLWAGFELAMKDLEIRWGWDLLGISQSGQKTDIGVNLFLKMVEKKVEEMKRNLKNPHPTLGTSQWEEEENSLRTTACKIDLNLAVSLPDKLFASSLDKINFYREIESINSLEDLKQVGQDFLDNPDPQTTNFFSLLKVKILAEKHKIISIKKLGIHYQIDLIPTANIEDTQQILIKDTPTYLSVVDITRLRTPIKNFENPAKFLQYLLLLFEGKISKQKIKIKKKI